MCTTPMGATTRSHATVRDAGALAESRRRSGGCERARARPRREGTAPRARRGRIQQNETNISGLSDSDRPEINYRVERREKIASAARRA